MVGNSGANVLSGGAGNDTLIGGAGDDRLIDTSGVVNMDGGSGNDTFLFSEFGISNSPLTGSVTGGDGTDTLDSSANALDLSNLTITGVERLFTASTTARAEQFNAFSEIASTFDALGLTLSGPGVVDFSRNVAVGLSLNVTGSIGNDTITGHAGVDTLRGGLGADTLTGGAGADTFLYLVGESTGAARDVVNDFQSGVDRIDLTPTSPGVTTLVRIGDVTRVLSQGATGPQTEIDVRGGIQGGDLMLQNPGQPVRGIDFLGQDGVEDRLTGSAGADNLFGFSGSDRLDGGAGDDQLFGDAGADVLIGGAGADHFAYRGVNDSNATSGYDIITDFASGTDKLDLYYLNGVQSVALVRSGGGTFAFASTSGGLVQVGFTGAVQGSDVVNSFGLPASFGYDLVGEAAGETLIGSGGNDRIYGLGGNDVIDGGAGNDILYGDAGADLLTGGAGADVFAYRAAGDSPQSGFDRILDFQTGVDKLDLRGVHTSGTDKYGVAVQGSDSLLFFDQGGDGSVDLLIVLSGVTNLQAADILF